MWKRDDVVKGAEAAGGATVLERTGSATPPIQPAAAAEDPGKSSVVRPAQAIPTSPRIDDWEQELNRVQSRLNELRARRKDVIDDKEALPISSSSLADILEKIDAEVKMLEANEVTYLSWMKACGDDFLRLHRLEQRAVGKKITRNGGSK